MRGRTSQPCTKLWNSPQPTEAQHEAAQSAKAAGLCYVSSDTPGIRRLVCGGGFKYLSPRGRTIRDAAVLRRIRALVIPPAWADVWICPHPRGHLQATGRDARGRKQHRYHPRWTEVRDADKYERMLGFGRALPRLRARVARDLRRPGLSREKVLAVIVALMEETAIRVGNEEYAKENGSIGLTTMRNRHVEIAGSELRFQFRGKSGVLHEVDLRDARLARIVKSCQELPGQELFQYVDANGRRHKIGSMDVNDYLRETMGMDFTAKDFRTWRGTVLAAEALRACGDFTSKVQAKTNVLRAIEKVAAHLGNTKTVCRKCYIHPLLLESYRRGEFLTQVKLPAAPSGVRSRTQLSPPERAVLGFLQGCRRKAA